MRPPFKVHRQVSKIGSVLYGRPMAIDHIYVAPIYQPVNSNTLTVTMPVYCILISTELGVQLLDLQVHISVDISETSANKLCSGNVASEYTYIGKMLL